VYLGGEILKNVGRSTLTEESALTGTVTNQFDETGDPLGGGIVIGDNFTLSNRNLIVGPFAAFDFLN